MIKIHSVNTETIEDFLTRLPKSNAKILAIVPSKIEGDALLDGRIIELQVKEYLIFVESD